MAKKNTLLSNIPSSIWARVSEDKGKSPKDRMLDNLKAKYKKAAGYSYAHRELHFDEDTNKDNYNNRRSDWIRRVQRGAVNVNKEAWELVKKGELGINDFQSLLESASGMNTGISGWGSQQFSNQWSGFGGYDKSLYGKYKQAETSRKGKESKKQLSPGMYEQTRGSVMDGILRNTAKKTILGQY